jgi:hypothetical protein
MYERTRSIIGALARLSSRPKSKPATSAIKTRVLSEGRDTRQSYVRDVTEQGKKKEGVRDSDALSKDAAS